jgi:hypothetical protein
MVCGPKRQAGNLTLAELVQEFLEGQSKCLRGELKGYRDIPLKTALIMAARADDGEGRCHPHQWRLWDTTARQAEIILLQNINKIAACKNFDSLHNLIKSILNIPGAAEMFWYDTAFRIGINLKIYPEKVYLHRGTRDGAKNLGLQFGRYALEISELPKELQRLKPHQIEDFFCVFKDSLRVCSTAKL